MANKNKIIFVDRADLLKKLDDYKLVVKKSDANKAGAVDKLQNALKKIKRNDKEATKAILKLRNRMLDDAGTVYAEVDEDQLFEITALEQSVIADIEIDD